MTVDRRPSAIQFKAPYARASVETPEVDDLLAMVSGFDVSKGHFSLSMTDPYKAPAFTAYVTPMPAGKVEAAIARPSTADALARIDATVKASDEDPAIAVVKGEFPVEIMPALRGSVFNLIILVDGEEAGTYQYDYTQVPWEAFRRDSESYYANARGVQVDADGNADFGNCSAPNCFLTIATVETVGLSDDCWELRVLRGFRDGPLTATPEGRALIQTYYAEAPRLVDLINRRSDAPGIWLRAYWRYILPCAGLACLRLSSLALKHYSRLFARLSALADEV